MSTNLQKIQILDPGLEQSIKVEEQQPPFECDLCNYICFSGDEQTKHILGHFKQRHCESCDKLLFQIGANWYEINLHIDEISNESNHMENIKIEGVEIEAELIKDADTGTVEKSAGLAPDEFDATDDSLSSDLPSVNGEPIKNQNELETEWNLNRTTENENSMPESKVKKAQIKEVTYICDICNKQFNTRTAIRKHITSLHGNPKKMFTDDMESVKCILCDEQFTNKLKWQRHRSYHISKLQKQDDFKFSCLFCRHKFKYEETLNAHTQVVHECRTPLKCNLCGKTFTNAHSLLLHAYAHSSQSEFTCTMCNNSYKSKPKLVHHLGIHVGFVHIKFNCDVCCKSFPRQEEVDAHKQVVHEGQKLFECETCGKSYDTDRLLKLHRKTHFSNNICHVCGHSFTSMALMSRHIRTHYGLKPFPCEVCGKSYTRKEHLVRHMNFHSGIKRYKCDVPKCKRSYNNKCDMQQHQLTTHGIKININEHECTLCSKVFVIKGLLKKHMHTHFNKVS